MDEFWATLLVVVLLSVAFYIKWSVRHGRRDDEGWVRKYVPIAVALVITAGIWFFRGFD